MLMKRGWDAMELGDPDVIAWQDQLHLFTATRSAKIVDHFVTSDGMHWEALPDAIHIGEPGDSDDDQIWTIHTFRWHDRFYMLYTCLARQEDGRLQRTGLAISDDLVHWEKVSHNPVAEPDPRWYEADLSSSGRADWRDPFPWVENGVIHALVCAHEKDGPFNRRGCVAHLTSSDALHWKVEPPFYMPGISTDFEVPCVFKLGDRYYLTGHICAPPIDVYRVADRLEGPWERPLDDILLPSPNHAFHVCTWGDKVMVFNWVSMTDDWSGRGGQVKVLAAPKVADALPDGRLVLRSFEEGWETVATESWQPIVAGDALAQGRACGGDWEITGDTVSGSSKPGMGIQFLAPAPDDFMFETTVMSVDAPEVGIVFRADDTADRCTRVSCIQGRCSIELARLIHLLNVNAIGRGYESLQSRFFPFTPGEPFRLRVTAYGPYIEVCVDQRVVLVSLTMSRRGGGLGVFVEDGTARFSDMRLRPLQAPQLRLPAGPVGQIK